MIALQSVSAGYDKTPIIQDITLDFQPGQVLALIGPNGSGKSTLLKAALRLLPTMQGEVLYDGVNVEKLKRKEIAQKAALLSQHRSTPSIQALRMVLHGRFPYLSYPRQYAKRDWAIARAAMDATGSRAHEDANVATLSGGQQQGVYLAMTLTQDTETVFMDEPTTYLDTRRQLQTVQTARSLAHSGKAVVLVLHDLSLALRGADRVAVLCDGKLQCCDTPQAVFESGVLERVFQVAVHRMETPQGVQYYSSLKEESPCPTFHCL